MPTKTRKPCRAPGCPNLCLSGESYCDDHKRERDRAYDNQRGSTAQRGYGAKWQRLRVMILARDPLCGDPFGIHAEHGELTPATEVDHIRSLRRGRRNTMDNLQALCRECHSRKTALEDGRWG